MEKGKLISLLHASQRCEDGQMRLLGDSLPGEVLPRDGDDLKGELSLPTMVFCTAIFSENFLSGSLRSRRSSSVGVYWSRNSSIER